MGKQVIPRSEAVVQHGTRSRLPRALGRELINIEGDAALRLATVRAETIIAREKLSELDYLTWKAMSGHAMLAGWAHHLAGDDPVLMDELRFFQDTARLGKAGIISDTIDSFRGM